MNMAAELADRAAAHGWADRTAYYEGEESITHGRLHDLAARAATVLAGHGVQRGSRVLIALPDSVAWVVAFLATARLGAHAVLANPAQTEADHVYLIKDAQVALAVTEDVLADRFTAIGHLSGERLLAQAEGAAPAPAAELAPDDTLYIQYTSGTTGPPKGVIHRQGDPETYYTGAGARVLGIRHDDVALSVSKLYFAYGFGNSLAFPLYSGSAAVLVPGPPHAAVVAGLVARHRVTYLHAVPSAYAALLADTDPGGYATVRAAVSAGERLTAARSAQIAAFLGAPVYDQLGSTEVGHAFCTNGTAVNRPGTIGRPVPGYELRLLDKAGHPVPDGTEGELWVRGPTVMPYYLNRPEETARSLNGGWLATRDLAVRHPDGSYEHRGRSDDLEMVGGITISPLEVEEVLSGHPGVRDVAVASIRNEHGASKLRAFVVPRSPGTELAAFEVELTSHARQHLAPYKVPRSVEFVGSLPRTATGKLRRFLVHQGAW